MKTIVISLAVTDVAFCEPGYLIVTGDEGCVTCYKTCDLSRVWAVSGGEMVNCVAAWGQRLVTGTDAGHLDIRDRDTGQVEAAELYRSTGGLGFGRGSPRRRRPRSWP